jgi:hypothetical protein
MVIYVREIAVAADTAKQGELLFTQLLAAFVGNEKVTLSFDGIDTATSSFVNAGLVQLLSVMTFEDIKSRLKVVSSTRQINDMIKRRLSHEAELSAA